MTIELYQRVCLTKDLPDEGLRRGDVATVVEKLPASDGNQSGPGCALEVFNALGETMTVVFVPESAVRPLTSEEVFNARPLAKAV